MVKIIKIIHNIKKYNNQQQQNLFFLTVFKLLPWNAAWFLSVQVMLVCISEGVLESLSLLGW